MRLLACLIVAPQRGYDEPATLSYAISSFCPTSADGLHSAKTVAHFCPAAATSSCGPAVAACIERLNTSKTPLIQRRDCIIPSLMFADIPSMNLELRT